MSDVTPLDTSWHPWNTSKTPQITIRYFNSDSSYLPSLTCNMDVRVHIGRSSGRYTPWYGHVVVKNGTISTVTATDIWHVVKNGNFTLLLTSSGQEMAISHCYWHLVVKNGNFPLLLTSSGHNFMLVTSSMVKNGNLTLLLSSSGQEWQFQLLLTSSGQEWQFHIATDI